MSRDIFVQDIPVGADKVEDIPDDWEPAPLRFGHREVVDALLALAPDADLSDPEWINIDLPGANIDVSVRQVERLRSFVLHVRGIDRAASDQFVARLLSALDARAFDPGSETGIFSSPR